MTTAMDAEGRCVAHPFMQLKLLSRRTGEWKDLLDSCPLCDIKDKKKGADKAKNGPRCRNSGQNRAVSRSKERALSVMKQRPGPRDSSLDSRRSYQSTRPRPRDSSVDSKRSYQSSRPHPKDASLDSSCRSNQPSRPRPRDASPDSSRRSYQPSAPAPRDASLYSHPSQSSRTECGDVILSSQGRSRSKGRSRSRSNSVSGGDLFQPPKPPPPPEGKAKRRTSTGNILKGGGGQDRAHPDPREVPPPPPPPLARTNSSGSGGYRQLAMVLPGSCSEIGVSPALSHILQGLPSSPVVAVPAPSKKHKKRLGSSRAAMHKHNEYVKAAEVLNQYSQYIKDAEVRSQYSEYVKDDDVRSLQDNTSSLPMADSKGRCVRHPNVRLRKKKLLGGWKVLLSACPDCCVDELKRMRCAEENMRRDGKERAERGCSGHQRTRSPSPDEKGRRGSSRDSRRRSRSRGSRGGSRGRPGRGGNLRPGPPPSMINASTLFSPSSDITFKKLRPPHPPLDASDTTASLTVSSSSSLAPDPVREAQRRLEDPQGWAVHSNRTAWTR